MPSQRRRNTPRNLVRRAFDRPALKRVCEMHELEFCDAYDMERHIIEKRKNGNNFYYFRDNGADILFVAHLDTVVARDRRRTEFCETINGPVVHSGALDDRLGAYLGLELMPKLLGEDWADVLLTVGEENHQSTAEFFTTEKEYNWVIEFDRKGDDVVMYQYDDTATAKLVRDSGAKVSRGTFSDIAELEHLKVKCFNWGCGYDGVYHSTFGYAYLENTYDMVVKFLRFHAVNADVRLAHEKKKTYASSWQGGKAGSSGGGSGGYGGSTSVRWVKGQRQVLRNGHWIDESYSASIGRTGSDGHADRRWDPDLKVWTSTDPACTAVWDAGRRWPTYEAFYKNKYPDDEGVWVMGEHYESYEEYWAVNHPEEPMVDESGYERQRRLDRERDDAMWEGTLWGHG